MFCSSQKSKCQDLPKFQFGGRGFCSSQKSNFNFQLGGCTVVVKSQNAKICLNFNFGGGGGGVVVVKNQSAKIWPTFHFGGGGCSVPEQGVLAHLSKTFALPLSGRPWITDSL